VATGAAFGFPDSTTIAGSGVALKIGGLQTLQAPYRFTASASDMGIELFASERQPARWYFSPVLVT
jgi:hypothetical protein